MVQGAVRVLIEGLASVLCNSPISEATCIADPIGLKIKVFQTPDKIELIK